MSTGAWRVKGSEVERALRSIRSAGLHIRSVELVNDGTIKITVSEAKTVDLEDIETPEHLRKLL